MGEVKLLRQHLPTSFALQEAFGMISIHTRQAHPIQAPPRLLLRQRATTIPLALHGTQPLIQLPRLRRTIILAAVTTMIRMVPILPEAPTAIHHPLAPPTPTMEVESDALQSREL